MERPAFPTVSPIKRIFMAEKKKPRNRRVAHLFEPVHTGGRPDPHFRGPRDPRRGKAHTPHRKSDSLSNKCWFKFSGYHHALCRAGSIIARFTSSIPDQA